MSARYTVVQYLPDPISEERLNVGVIVWDDNGVRCRFLNNWARAQSFGGERIGFLKEFARHMIEATTGQPHLPGFTAGETADAAALEKIVQGWGHSIQFTTPRGSLKNADALLEDIAPLFLRDRVRERARARTRTAAAKIAADILFSAVKKRAPENADKLVKKNAPVDGAVEPHQFDVVLANGKVLAAVHAISFEISEGEHLEKEVVTAKWMLADVRRKHHKVPLAVFAFPPAKDSVASIYKDTTRIIKALDADVLSSQPGMVRWAGQRAQELHG